MTHPARCAWPWPPSRRLALAPRPRAQDQAPPAPEPTLPAFLDRLEAAWQTARPRGLAGAARVRDAAEERTLEEETAARLVRLRRGGAHAAAPAEPRPGRHALRGRGAGLHREGAAARASSSGRCWSSGARRPWPWSSRQDGGQMDGLVHLSLGPQAFRARGVTLRREGLRAAARGRHAVLVARGGRADAARVRRHGTRALHARRPPPSASSCGSSPGEPSIEREVDWAFVRIHPVEFERARRRGQPLEPEPTPARRRAEAERIFRERSERSFIVDAPLPRSPWWLMPGPRRRVVDFPWGRKRVLTFALTSSEAEDVNLFDRDRRLQICSYPSSGTRAALQRGRRPRARRAGARHQRPGSTPRATSSPRRTACGCGCVNPAATLRLRLDDDFRVSSVQSGDGGNLLFFRVRDQGTLVVSLGPLASREEPFTLVTRYSGRHNPAAVDQELVQVARPAWRPDGGDEVFMDRPPIVYANRTAWYPRPPNEDFATRARRVRHARGLAGRHGRRAGLVAHQGGRTRAEFRMAQAGQVRHRDRGPPERRGPAPGGRAVGARLRHAAHAPRDARRRCRTLERMLAFYAEKFGPSPYPTLGLVVAEGETPGGHSPPGLLYLQQRPPILRSRALARGSLELQRPARLLPRPRGGAPVVGPGDGARELPRALAVRGVGAVRGGAVAARAARRARVPAR